MSTLTVLCPNGRRQQVKVQPSTKILDIIDEVCKKQGLNPNEFDLIHHKKIQDVTFSFRLSGIPNNAQLELRKCEFGPRQFDKVTLSLQMNDGSRLEPQQFKPDTDSLLSVIEKYVSLNLPAGESLKAALQESTNELYPSFSYLNEQVVGLYQLRNTTLKDLGLTGGRFVIRFDFRKMDQDQVDKLNSEFKLKLEKKMKLNEIFENKSKENDQTSPTTSHESTNNTQIEIERQQSATVQEQATKVAETQERRVNSVEQQQNRQVVDKKPRLFDDKEYDIVKPNEFANFKFPEETKGHDLNNVNELAEIEEESKRPCDRQAVLVHLEKQQENSSKQTPNEEENSEEFYNVTVDDLKYMLSDLKKSQTGEAPLMTKQMRELEQDRKAMRYTHLVIRVVFKDRQTLQGLFRPKEPVSALYHFVREHLSVSENESDDLDFFLFTTPPKCVLSNDAKKNLFEMNLCPAALVYFSNKSDRVPQFKRELCESGVKSIEEADQIVCTHVHQKIRNIEHEGMNLLLKEQMVAGNILKSSGLMSGKPSGSSSERGARTSEDRQGARAEPTTDVNKKLGRFLGKK